jgi:GDPmannose 4,6-dehydratase
MSRALITGVTGQDGSYLAELLLEKGYEVHGVSRAANSLEQSRISHLLNNPAIKGRRFFLHRADLNDFATPSRLLAKTSPDEIYHLAGQSHVGASFEKIEPTCEITGMGTLRLLEAIRNSGRKPRFFHASSSEIFGRPEIVPQDEQTPSRPVTPYGCAKAFATSMVSIYRQTFGLFACNGILYNHESPRRGENFAPQKICLAAAAIKQGLADELLLGSLDTRRDWGDARDYVRGMWLALQHARPEDFVFATGDTHTVQEVVETAFGAHGLDWKKFVKQDARFMRSEEPARLVGNPAKAERLLNWRRTNTFKQLITEMTRAPLEVRPAAAA